MEFNKQRFAKINDKKILHKVKKQWVIVSMALLGTLGVNVAHQSVHASQSTVPGTNVHQRTSNHRSYTLQDPQSITRRSHQLTSQLLAQQAVVNNQPHHRSDQQNQSSANAQIKASRSPRLHNLLNRNLKPVSNPAPSRIEPSGNATPEQLQKMWDHSQPAHISMSIIDSDPTLIISDGIIGGSQAGNVNNSKNHFASLYKAAGAKNLSDNSNTYTIILKNAIAPRNSSYLFAFGASKNGVHSAQLTFNSEFSFSSSSANGYSNVGNRLDTSHVINLACAFLGDYLSSDSSSDFGNWNTHYVTNLSGTFWHVRGDVPSTISNWDTRNVTNMSYLFDKLSDDNAYSLDLSRWRTSHVTNMKKMFDKYLINNAQSGSSNAALPGGLSDWDTSRVTDMYKMFYNMGLSSKAKNPFESVLPWNVSRVKDLEHLFYDPEFFNLRDLRSALKVIESWYFLHKPKVNQMFVLTSVISKYINKFYHIPTQPEVVRINDGGGTDHVPYYRINFSNLTQTPHSYYDSILNHYEYISPNGYHLNSDTTAVSPNSDLSNLLNLPHFPRAYGTYNHFRSQLRPIKIIFLHDEEPSNKNYWYNQQYQRNWKPGMHAQTVFDYVIKLAPAITKPNFYVYHYIDDKTHKEVSSYISDNPTINKNYKGIVDPYVYDSDGGPIKLINQSTSPVNFLGPTRYGLENTDGDYYGRYQSYDVPVHKIHVYRYDYVDHGKLLPSENNNDSDARQRESRSSLSDGGFPGYPSGYTSDGPINDPVLEPNQTYWYSGIEKHGLINVYTIPVRSDDHQRKIPMIGDRLVGTLPIPIYDDTINRLMGNLNLDFSQLLQKKPLSDNAIPGQALYAGDTYQLDINDQQGRWLQNYITQHYFNGNPGFVENAPRLNEFVSDRDPQQLYLQFRNYATAVDSGQPSDNHLDLFVGFGPNSDSMRDVATVQGREVPDRNSNDGFDYQIGSLDWHQTGNSNHQLVGTNGANPLSLHYHYTATKHGAVYYTNYDGDLVDANPADHNLTSDHDNHVGTYGHVVRWTNSDNHHVAGEAVSGYDVRSSLNDFEHFAQIVSNSDGRGNKRPIVTIPNPLPNILADTQPKFDFTQNSWQADAHDQTGHAVIFINNVPGQKVNQDQTSYQDSGSRTILGRTYPHVFAASDTVNGDLPNTNTQGSTQGKIDFIIPESSDGSNLRNNPIHDGDTAVILPFADQVPDHIQPGEHYITPVNNTEIPTSLNGTEHGTFDANGDFVPDDYEHGDLKWAPSSETVQYVLYDPTHHSGQTANPDNVPGYQNETYVGTTRHGDYVGGDVMWGSDSLIPQALRAAGYTRLDPYAEHANDIDGHTQFFELGVGNHMTNIYVSKANAIPSNNPRNPSHYVPINSVVNPNFDPNRPVGPGNEPYLPGKQRVPNDQPDPSDGTHPNTHHNLIPSPNHQHDDSHNPADHNGMVPSPVGWLPDSDVPAVQADFTIRAEISNNDGGGYINGSDIPVAVDINANNNALNTTYTLSTKNIREAIVNHAYAQGYTDRDGQTDDLQSDSIMRTPGIAYEPIKYQIHEDSTGSYHIVLVGNNANAGKFMFTPSNAIINYHGTIFHRDAAGKMKPVMKSDASDQIESVIAEGYQGMVVSSKNNDVRSFFDADGWTANPVNGEIFHQFKLEGYDWKYLNHQERDPKDNGLFNQLSDDAGLKKRRKQYHQFFKKNSDSDLAEQNYLDDEAAAAEDNGSQLLNVASDGNLVYDASPVVGMSRLAMRRSNRLNSANVKTKSFEPQKLTVRVSRLHDRSQNFDSGVDSTRLRQKLHLLGNRDVNYRVDRRKSK